MPKLSASKTKPEHILISIWCNRNISYSMDNNSCKQKMNLLVVVRINSKKNSNDGGGLS